MRSAVAVEKGSWLIYQNISSAQKSGGCVKEKLFRKENFI
jgi:hypothetical protein